MISISGKGVYQYKANPTSSTLFLRRKLSNRHHLLLCRSRTKTAFYGYFVRDYCLIPADPVPQDLPFTYAYTRGQNVPERLFALGKAPEKGGR